jgi:hypothetical protein
MQTGRNRNNPAAGGTIEMIFAEVCRTFTDERSKAIVREGVEDALEGRRPKW